jgi:hypothetical protein
VCRKRTDRGRAGGGDVEGFFHVFDDCDKDRAAQEIARAGIGCPERLPEKRCRQYVALSYPSSSQKGGPKRGEDSPNWRIHALTAGAMRPIRRNRGVDQADATYTARAQRIRLQNVLHTKRIDLAYMLRSFASIFRRTAMRGRSRLSHRSLS